MNKVIQIAPRELLLTQDYLYDLAKVLVALDLSRRATAEWMAATLFKADEEGWIFLTGEGQCLFIHEDIVEEAHGDDPHMTCVSDLKRKATNPPRRRPRTTTLRRLQLYDACFKLAGRPIRRVDRWAEAQRMRRLVGAFSPARRAYYRKAVRDLKRRMGERPNPIAFSHEVKALRLRFSAEGAHWEANR